MSNRKKAVRDLKAEALDSRIRRLSAELKKTRDELRAHVRESSSQETK